MDHVINVTLLVPVNADFDLELYGPYLKDYSKNGTGVEETIATLPRPQETGVYASQDMLEKDRTISLSQ